MITDERRRKVAAELRELAANRHYVDEFIAADTVGFYRGEAVEGFDSDSLLEVADLIDRPACKIILARELRTAYGKPITGINGYILSCGHQAVGFEKPRYCPECGMEVGKLLTMTCTSAAPVAALPSIWGSSCATPRMEPYCSSWPAPRAGRAETSA